MMRRLCKKRLASQFTTAEGRAELNVNVCALLTDTNLRNYCLLYRRLQLQSMSIITIVALLVFLTIPEGESNLLKNKLFLQFLPACTHSLICVPVSGLAFCNQQHALLCLCPDSDILFRTSHYLRQQSGGSNTASAMSVHHQGEKTHRTLHRTSGGDSCQLPLQRD